MPRHAGHNPPTAPTPATNPRTPGPRPAYQPPEETPGVTLVTGEPQRLSSLTAALRRARLGAAALFLVVTLVALFVRSVLTGTTELISFQAAVVASLTAALGLLWSRVPLSTRGVRALEFTVFGLTAVFLAARQHQLMQVWLTLRTGQEASVVSAVKTTTIGTILLTFAYSMFIPNTWREAARVVAALVTLPIVTELFLLATHPGAYQVVFQFVTPGRVTEDVGNMVIAAGLSVYGTHVINSLRTEAFEAREMNQYHLGRRLGGGGMGEVYLAEHRLLKRPCALKLVRAGAAGDPVLLSRFEREVRATARLSHPNTVEIYDYGRAESGTFYYVMEYLRGLSLDDLVKRHGPMPPGRVIFLLTQVCGALSEAHAAGLIHRDVKPANIFACFRGGRYDVAKLLDFGLVMAVNAQGSWHTGMEPAHAGMVRGTPLYMAPEQITASPHLDHRCDLYALGSVAYTLLTGRPPFEGTDSVRVMTAQVRDPVDPPRRTRPDLPEDLERVVLRCLSKSPDSRFPDAESLSQALSACRSAGDWNAAKAALWWRSVEPAATATEGP